MEAKLICNTPNILNGTTKKIMDSPIKRNRKKPTFRASEQNVRKNHNLLEFANIHPNLAAQPSKEQKISEVL